MFRQILVDKQDKPLILEEKRRGNIEDLYKLNTVTYGTASAPYHVIRCLQELAIQIHQEEYPMAAHAITEDFYIDNVLSSKRLSKCR